MCVVSNVGDYWREQTLPQKYPEVDWDQWIQYPHETRRVVPTEYVTKEQFQELKKDVEELKKLLIAAKRYDEQVGEPECEHDEKVALIKAVAEAVGVDLTEVFGRSTRRLDSQSIQLGTKTLEGYNG